MTPGARLAAAIEVLADLEARRRPVSEALKGWGLTHRFAGSGDRSVIGNIVYDALRWRASTAWVMGEETPRALVLGMVALHWGLGVEGINQMVTGDAHAPPPLSDEEAARLTSADMAGAPDHVRADVPEWLGPKLARQFGENWVAEGIALALRPPLDMRANRLKAETAKVEKALSKFGAALTHYAPDGLRIAPTEGQGRHPNVQVEPAFQKGWFEIQDEGSQVAASLASAKPGHQVLDLCAGAGGKTLALAAMMENKGQVLATDRDRTRLAPIFERLKRAGTRNVQVREAGADLSDLARRMDIVLVDAPCTGTGVWRRRPDAKWRVTEQALGDRLAEQTAILDEAAGYVKPGGRLVYVTCSLLPEEDGDQVAGFVERHPDFAVVPPLDVIAASGLPANAQSALAGAALATVNGIVLTPRRTGTDGFFIGVVARKS
ncbi:MAG TPA: RsmB/NOP family class I SAM-dependent RNA methyltransferase [Bauldia sp.]|nr:RsmB/NOP family class I SAM-dependent RNA methyltransferase [Bauldia sp.]